MNKIIKFLTLYDMLALGGFGLINPIFAVFIVNNINGGSIFVAGTAITVYAFTKALIQIPISKYTDKEVGNKREFKALLFGSVIMAVVPLLYLMSENIFDIYFAQFLLGVGASFSYPGWMTIFVRFTKKGKEGYSWSFYNTFVIFSIAISATVGGYLAQNFGFGAVFFLMFIFTVCSVLLVLKMHGDIINKKF